MAATTAIHGGEALRQACRELGLSDRLADELLARLLSTGGPAAVSSPQAMADREAEMMSLLKTSSPDRLIHDLRNVLNELALLKAAADF